MNARNTTSIADDPNAASFGKAPTMPLSRTVESISLILALHEPARNASTLNQPFASAINGENIVASSLTSVRRGGTMSSPTSKINENPRRYTTNTASARGIFRFAKISAKGSISAARKSATSVIATTSRIRYKKAATAAIISTRNIVPLEIAMVFAPPGTSIFRILISVFSVP